MYWFYTLYFANFIFHLTALILKVDLQRKTAGNNLSWIELGGGQTAQGQNLTQAYLLERCYMMDVLVIKGGGRY